jgi:excisionase family DNA binding protein
VVACSVRSNRYCIVNTGSGLVANLSSPQKYFQCVDIVILCGFPLQFVFHLYVGSTLSAFDTRRLRWFFRASDHEWSGPAVSVPSKSFPIPSAALSVDEAADYLRISRASVWRLLRNRAIARVRIGKRTVVRRVDLDSFLERAAAA